MVYRKESPHGFTIVELLVVIVVIGILAAITIVSYSGIQTRAQISKINDDLALLSKAIQAARIVNGKTLLQMDGYNYSAGRCTSHASGTDLAALPRTDICWSQYLADLNAISQASGISVQNLVDPWGRPYSIDENEGESGGCSKDFINVFSYPYVANTWYPDISINVPLSGYTGCAI